MPYLACVLGVESSVAGWAAKSTMMTPSSHVTPEHCKASVLTLTWLMVADFGLDCRGLAGVAVRDRPVPAVVPAFKP